MTQPNPDDARAKAEAEAKAKAEADAKAAAGPKRGQVVHFTARNGHTGEQFDGIGVVTLVAGGGDVVLLRPLQEFDVQVAPADVEPVLVDED